MVSVEVLTAKFSHAFTTKNIISARNHGTIFVLDFPFPPCRSSTAPGDLYGEREGLLDGRVEVGLAQTHEGPPRGPQAEAQSQAVRNGRRR